MSESEIHEYVRKKLGHVAPYNEVSFFLDLLSVRSVSAGSLLFSENSIDNNNYYLINGLLKTYFEKEEKKVITNFIRPQNLISNLCSEISEGKAWQTVEAVTDCLLLCITREKLYLIFKTSPALANKYLSLATRLLIVADNRLKYLISKNAKEKYRLFAETYNEYIDKIPQYEIASFLDITPETMSRIKSELVEKGQ